jgi:hypothetical protein
MSLLGCEGKVRIDVDGVSQSLHHCLTCFLTTIIISSGAQRRSFRHLAPVTNLCVWAVARPVRCTLPLIFHNVRPGRGCRRRQIDREFVTIAFDICVCVLSPTSLSERCHGSTLPLSLWQVSKEIAFQRKYPQAHGSSPVGLSAKTLQIEICFAQASVKCEV